MTKEIFFRIVNTPSIRRADYFPKFDDWNRPSRYANFLPDPKKTPLGAFTYGVTQLTTQPPAFFTPAAPDLWFNVAIFR
jgi:hypothetical protein